MIAMKNPGKAKWNRGVEKQAARDRDEKRLAEGSVSPEELNRENSFFAGFDLSKIEIEKWR